MLYFDEATIGDFCRLARISESCWAEALRLLRRHCPAQAFAYTYMGTLPAALLGDNSSSAKKQKPSAEASARLLLYALFKAANDSTRPYADLLVRWRRGEGVAGFGEHKARDDFTRSFTERYPQCRLDPSAFDDSEAPSYALSLRPLCFNCVKVEL